MYKPYVIGLYIRLSSEDSKVGSFSIENQKRALHQYADAMEDAAHAEVLEFVDNGYSGTNFERPAVQELLDKVREGAVNCIIVKDFTRFGRNSIEVGYFMERVFPLYGVRFISLNDGFDSDTLHGDTGGINVAFQYLISEFYSRDLSIKYKTAKYVKFRRGEYQSVLCPYGYQKGADGRMEPDEETAPNSGLSLNWQGAAVLPAKSFRNCTSAKSPHQANTKHPREERFTIFPEPIRFGRDRPFGTSCWMNATLALMSWAGNRWSRWGAAGYGTVMKANGSGFRTTIRPSSAKSCSSGCRN